jgi:hypothetical protein
MHQSFNQRVHFYYCILVALKIHGKSKKSGGIRGKNNFLLKWLRKAQDNNIFHPDITSEIEWLRGKIIQAGMTPIWSRCWISSMPRPNAPKRSRAINRPHIAHYTCRAPRHSHV